VETYRIDGTPPRRHPASGPRLKAGVTWRWNPPPQLLSHGPGPVHHVTPAPSTITPAPSTITPAPPPRHPGLEPGSRHHSSKVRTSSADHSYHGEKPLRLHPDQQTERHTVRRRDLRPRTPRLAAQKPCDLGFHQPLPRPHPRLVRIPRIHDGRHNQGEVTETLAPPLEAGVDRAHQSHVAGPVRRTALTDPAPPPRLWTPAQGRGDDIVGPG